MATPVFSDNPANLTSAVYFDGTDNPNPAAAMASTFAGVDADEDMLPAEQGAVGLVGPVTGAQHMPNAAQPGSTAI